MTYSPRRRLLAVLATTTLLSSTLGVTGAVGEETAAGEGTSGAYDRVVDITFPVGGDHYTPDTYDSPRGGSSKECSAQGVSGRVHQATDVMAGKMQPVYAAQSGVVRWAPETEPSYGWMISILGDDGIEYNYVHLNNDTPGTDDGNGGIDHAYAPGVRQGVQVSRGQHIGWVGDSGNAEGTAPHLHFEMEDPNLDDPRLECPYQSDRMNPYPSLMAALERGDVPPAKATSGPGGTTEAQPAAEPWIFADVPPDGTHAGSIEALVDAEVTAGCARTDSFCPNAEVKRDQMSTFIRKAMGLPEGDASAMSSVEDVPGSNVHSGAIAILLAEDIATLCDEGRFCPGEALTRADMAVWIANALGISGGEATFVDVAADAPYADAVAAIADLGITTGCSDVEGGFCPDQPVKRGQMATFLVTAFLTG